ncbi:hypothetical protein AAFF_G00394020 [Aldrovandia affinis]|uniref:Uncharacterized protein n=1 Tax=Aldrovandia affinis TaxID=143900 RepID=A0AAD7WKY0_9TELE|nr:hypothetical protein AAFF_G00394020 [Aldrovandia affinis]
MRNVGEGDKNNVPLSFPPNKAEAVRPTLAPLGRRQCRCHRTARAATIAQPTGSRSLETSWIRSQIPAAGGGNPTRAAPAPTQPQQA